MAYSLAQLADLIDGQLTGDGNLQVENANILRDANSADISLAIDDGQSAALANSQALAVVVGKEFQPEGIPFITVDDPVAAFGQIVSRFRPRSNSRLSGVSPAAHISPSAKIAADVVIHPRAVIEENVTIGRGTTIHAGVTIMAGSDIGEKVTIFPNAVLYELTRVGNRSIIHAGAVLGAYGFGYDSAVDGHILSSQLGFVELGEDVEVGAATTIDRGTFGATTIGDGTKLDNLVMIGHNCRIGRHNLICSQVGIAGSCTTGDFVVMAGQVGVRDHVEIGSQAVLGAKSGVSHDLPGEERYLGSPAIPARQQIQIILSLQKLPEMKRHLRMLRRQIDVLLAEQSEAKPRGAEKDHREAA